MIRNRLHITRKVAISATTKGVWLTTEDYRLLPPATETWAIHKISFHNPLSSTDALSVRKAIGEKYIEFISSIPPHFFMGREVIALLEQTTDPTKAVKPAYADVAYVKGTATTYVPDDSTLGGVSLASSGTIPISLHGAVYGLPQIRFPSPIVVNPHEKLEFKIDTGATSGNVYVTFEGVKLPFRGIPYGMKFLPYLVKATKTTVANTDTVIWSKRAEAYRYFIQTFAVLGVTDTDGDLKIRKNEKDILDTLKVGTEINECPLTSLERMYPLNENLGKGEILELILNESNAESVTTFVIGRINL